VFIVTLYKIENLNTNFKLKMEFLDDRRADFWLFELLTHVDCDEPPLPPPLRRESNERYLYFGLYPYACAMIVTKEFFDHVGKYVIEPIAGIKNKDFRVIKADVISKIYLIYYYLELSGFTWEKDKNVITVEIDGKRSNLEIYVCDGMFYILLDELGSIFDSLQNIFI